MDDYALVVNTMRRVYDRMEPMVPHISDNIRTVWKDKHAYCVYITMMFRWILFKCGIKSKQITIISNRETISAETGEKLQFAHAIAEVLIDGTWYVFDPTCNIDYGMSFETILENPSTSDEAVKRANMYDDPRWKESIERNAGGLGRGYHDFVGSALFGDIKEWNYEGTIPGYYRRPRKCVVVVHGDFDSWYTNESDPWNVGRAESDYRNELLKWVPDCGSILDVGCGNGAFTRRMFDGQRTITGIDISTVAIEKASKNYPAIDFACADARYCECMEAECVVLSEVLYYYGNHDIRRILYNIWGNSKNVLMAHWCGPPNDGYLTAEQYEKLFKEYFNPIKVGMINDHYIFLGKPLLDITEEAE